MNQDGMRIRTRVEQLLTPENQIYLANDTTVDLRNIAKLPIASLVANYSKDVVETPLMDAFKELFDFFNVQIMPEQAHQFVFALLAESALSIADISRLLGLVKIGKLKPDFRLDIPFLFSALAKYRQTVAKARNDNDVVSRNSQSFNDYLHPRISYDEWCDEKLKNNPNFIINFGSRKTKI